MSLGLSCCQFFAFADLLTPHRIIQTLFLQQFFMIAGFYNVSFFQHIDPVSMHDRRKTVRNKDRDLLPPMRTHLSWLP